MQKIFPLLLSCVGLLFAGVDVQVHINVGPPDIVFAAPPALVVVTPGISVIPDYPEEVFFVSGSYWTIREGHWFRCLGPHKKWILIQDGRVPHGLLKFRPGMYRNWHPEKRDHDDNNGNGEYGHGHDHGRGHGHGHD